MYIGNVFLLVLNLPLIPLWVRILKIPYEYLAVSIILFCLIGAYSLNNNITDIFIAVAASLVGVLMKRFDYKPTPLILAFVLGPILETALRRSLILSEGSFLIFLQRPVSAALLAVAFSVLLFPFLSRMRGRQIGGRNG